VNEKESDHADEEAREQMPCERAHHTDAEVG